MVDSWTLLVFQRVKSKTNIHLGNYSQCWNSVTDTQYFWLKSWNKHTKPMHSADACFSGTWKYHWQWHHLSVHLLLFHHTQYSHCNFLEHSELSDQLCHSLSLISIFCPTKMLQTLNHRFFSDKLTVSKILYCTLFGICLLQSLVFLFEEWEWGRW